MEFDAVFEAEAEQTMTNPVPASLHELVYNNIIQIEAIIRLLDKKGLMTQKEILEEVRKVKQELAEKGSKN
jgi:hypothetical protein